MRANDGKGGVKIKPEEMFLTIMTNKNYGASTKQKKKQWELQIFIILFIFFHFYFFYSPKRQAKMRTNDGKGGVKIKPEEMFLQS